MIVTESFFAFNSQEIPFPAFMKPDAVDLITKLLDVDDKTRLGEWCVRVLVIAGFWFEYRKMNLLHLWNDYNSQQ